jgi:hypothetical protein
MDAVEVLTQARALIAEPEHWTQHRIAIYAVDDTERILKTARAWCAWGAVLAMPSNLSPSWMKASTFRSPVAFPEC